MYDTIRYNGARSILTEKDKVKGRLMCAEARTVDIDSLVKEMVFGSDNKAKQKQIRELAKSGAFSRPASRACMKPSGRERTGGLPYGDEYTGITYDVARAAFRAAIKDKVGAFIFELAAPRWDIPCKAGGIYGLRLGAALAEGYRGPVFIQGDHIQMGRKNYKADPKRS
jgi:hypothetical protein